DESGQAVRHRVRDVCFRRPVGQRTQRVLDQVQRGHRVGQFERGTEPAVERLPALRERGGGRVGAQYLADADRLVGLEEQLEQGRFEGLRGSGILAQRGFEQGDRGGRVRAFGEAAALDRT